MIQTDMSGREERQRAALRAELVALLTAGDGAASLRTLDAVAAERRRMDRGEAFGGDQWTDCATYVAVMTAHLGQIAAGVVPAPVHQPELIRKALIALAAQTLAWLDDVPSDVEEVPF